MDNGWRFETEPLSRDESAGLPTGTIAIVIERTGGLDASHFRSRTGRLATGPKTMPAMIAASRGFQGGGKKQDSQQS